MRGTTCVQLINSTLLIFLLSIAIEATRPAYRKDYRYEKAFDAFYKLHHTAVDWHRARIRCEAEGAELAVPETLDEADALMLVISPSLNKEGVFIGVHDIYAEGLFVTINGDFFANTFMELLWEQLQPKQGDGRCVGMRRNGKLFVHDCLKRLPFICKKTSDIVFYPDCFTYDNRWVLGPNDTCYMTHTEQQTWHDAFDTCAGAGGYLATLNTKNETDYIASLFNQVVQPVTEDDFAFLGFNDLFIRFHYRTIFGDALVSQPADWDTKCSDEEDLKNVEQRCGGISRTGLLTTSACGTPAVFFCEKPANDSSAVQISTVATTITTPTLKKSVTKAIPNKKSTNTTPSGKSKNKLRNLDTSHVVTFSSSTRQARENAQAHGGRRNKTVKDINSYTSKTVDKTSVSVNSLINLDTTLAVETFLRNDNTSPKADIVSSDEIEPIYRPSVRADESSKTEEFLEISDSSKAARDNLNNVNMPNKSLEVLRFVTTPEVESILEDYNTSSKGKAVKEDMLPKIDTDSVNQDTVLPAVNRDLGNVDATSSTLNIDSVGEDTSPTVKTDLIEEDAIPIDADTVTEEPPTPHPLQATQNDNTNHEDSTTDNIESEKQNYDYLK